MQAGDGEKSGTASLQGFGFKRVFAIVRPWGTAPSRTATRTRSGSA